MSNKKVFVDQRDNLLIFDYELIKFDRTSIINDDEIMMIEDLLTQSISIYESHQANLMKDYIDEFSRVTKLLGFNYSIERIPIEFYQSFYSIIADKDFPFTQQFLDGTKEILRYIPSEIPHFIQFDFCKSFFESNHLLFDFILQIYRFNVSASLPFVSSIIHYAEIISSSQFYVLEFLESLTLVYPEIDVFPIIIFYILQSQQIHNLHIRIIDNLLLNFNGSEIPIALMDMFQNSLFIKNAQESALHILLHLLDMGIVFPQDWFEFFPQLWLSNKSNVVQYACSIARRFPVPIINPTLLDVLDKDLSFPAKKEAAMLLFEGISKAQEDLLMNFNPMQIMEILEEWEATEEIPSDLIKSVVERINVNT